jgi:hypothetical protein
VQPTLLGNTAPTPRYGARSKRERDNLLKEYRSDVYPLEEISIEIELGPARPNSSSAKLSSIEKIGENIYKPMLHGPWAGEDARDVVQQAIEWWQRQLDEIDGRALSL